MTKNGKTKRRTKVEEPLFGEDAVTKALREQNEANQLRIDRTYINDFFNPVDGATDVPDDAVLMAGVYKNGGYRDIKVVMQALRHLSIVVRRLIK